MHVHRVLLNTLLQVHLHFLTQDKYSQAQHLTMMLTHSQLYSGAECYGRT